MIRHDALGDDGEPAWVLIDQTEHARISGDLARAWGGDRFRVVDPRDTLLSAIYRHDDGWPAYDRAPDVDSHTGRPVAFTEMELGTAQAIWTQSIEKMADLGPLAQYIVACHFVAMRRDGERAMTPEGAEFVRTFQTHCDRWLRQWQEADPRTNTTQRARFALQQLQLFDAWSLWICCDARSTPTTFLTPEGYDVTLRPSPLGNVEITPWPFAVDDVKIEIAGRLVPVRFYRDKEALAAVAGQRVQLQWKLMPAWH